MKIPSSKEALLVWPPMGIGMGLFVVMTSVHVFSQYHQHLSLREGDSIYAAYLFPIAMAFAFALRLHGKYCLGFAWAAFVSYFMAAILTLFLNGPDFIASCFIVFACLAILFGTQSLLLFAKQVWWHDSD